MELIIGICDDCMEQVKLLTRYLHKFENEFSIEVISSCPRKIYFKDKGE